MYTFTQFLMQPLSYESMRSWPVPLFFFFFLFHVDVREPVVLVPVFLWLFRQHDDQLVGFNLLQPSLHFRTSARIWRAGQRCVCGDTPRTAWSLQVWTKLAGGHLVSHVILPFCCVQRMSCFACYEYSDGLCVVMWCVFSGLSSINVLADHSRCVLSKPSVFLHTLLCKSFWNSSLY